MLCLLVSFNQAALLFVADDKRSPHDPPCSLCCRVLHWSLLHVQSFIITCSHKCINASSHTQAYTQTHNEGMAKQTTHMPLHVDSQWGFCSACMLPCLCHVFHINVLVWWVPAGGGVGALSQGCACGPNPLINSASTGCRWQVGTETGCTPPRLSTPVRP